MKVVKLTTDYSSRIVNFLVAKNITFMFKYRELFILEECNAEHFKAYCVEAGVPYTEIAKIDISETKLNINETPFEVSYED